MKTNLKTARKACALTQGDIARSLHVSVQTVFKWEDGRAPVARRHWEKLASVLHVNAADMEKVLVQTLLDGCIARNNIQALINAEISRLYSATLIYDALNKFSIATNTRQAEHNQTLCDMEKLDYERAIFERDKKIFELDQRIAELEKELERARPATPLSSVLKHITHETEVTHERK